MACRLKLALMTALLSTSVYAADGPPGTDIYMTQLDKNKSGIYQAGPFVQLTTHKGYDNQPNFLPNGKGLLYTSMHQKADGNWQSDSFEYDFASQKLTNLTNTQTSEYSPTLMNNGQFFSTIVERENQQQFWAQPYKVKRKPYRINQAEPVGYHVWGSDDDLVMFVLGKPHTLQYQVNMDSQPKVVANDIGRSLRFVKSRYSFSFSQQKGKTWYLSEYYPNKDKVVNLVPMLAAADYYTWLDDTTAISAVGQTIYQWRYDNSARGIRKASEADWMPWLDVSKYCKTKVTRLAVNAQHSKLALVCDEK